MLVGMKGPFSHTSGRQIKLQGSFTPTNPFETPHHYLVVFKDVSDFYLGPLPWGLPGEGPDCHFPKELGGFGPIPARIRGVICFNFYFRPKRS